MNRTMRITATAMAALMVVGAGLVSPVAGSAPRLDERIGTYDLNEFFPMAVGNSWQWAAADDVKQLRIVDEMRIDDYSVWVAETNECMRGESQTASVMYFVDHEDGLFATRYLDAVMDWSHDKDDTSMLQRWSHRKLSSGTHSFNSGGAAQAYTVAIESGVPAMRVHDVEDETTYQEYAYGVGPVKRGNFRLERATIHGVEYVL